MLVDKNEVFWACGTAGSTRYDLLNIFFGLKRPFLKKDSKNRLMGGKSTKKKLLIPKKKKFGAATSWIRKII